MLPDLLMQAMPFSAQYKNGRVGVVDIAVKLVPTLIDTINPEAAPLHVFERLGHIPDPRHRNMRERAGRRFPDRLRESGSPPLRNEYRLSARGVGGADNSAQVVRIFDPIEQHDELCAHDNVRVRGISMRRSDGHDALVRGAIRHAVQSLARLEPHRDLAAAAKIDDRLHARTARSPRNQNAIDRPSRRDRLPYWMDAR